MEQVKVPSEKQEEDAEESYDDEESYEYESEEESKDASAFRSNGVSSKPSRAASIKLRKHKKSAVQNETKENSIQHRESKSDVLVDKRHILIQEVNDQSPVFVTLKPQSALRLRNEENKEPSIKRNRLSELAGNHMARTNPIVHS